jgi:hypothetical protein
VPTFSGPSVSGTEAKKVRNNRSRSDLRSDLQPVHARSIAIAPESPFVPQHSTLQIAVIAVIIVVAADLVLMIGLMRRADAFLILSFSLGPWLAWPALPRTIRFIYYYLLSATVATSPRRELEHQWRPITAL